MTGWGTKRGIFMREEEWRNLEASFLPAAGMGSAVLGLPVGGFPEAGSGRVPVQEGSGLTLEVVLLALVK